MVAAAGFQGQVWFWAARQEEASAGIPSGVGVMRLQPARLRVWVCRPTPRPTLAATQGQEKKCSIQC